MTFAVCDSNHFCKGHYVNITHKQGGRGSPVQTIHASYPSFVTRVIEILTLCELRLMGSQALWQLTRLSW